MAVGCIRVFFASPKYLRPDSAGDPLRGARIFTTYPVCNFCGTLPPKDLGFQGLGFRVPLWLYSDPF